MALTDFQRDLCRVMADARIARGESYIAGGAALNAITISPRVSRDLDVFHDTADAVARSWAEDRTLLESAGCEVTPVRERRTFVEAVARRGADSTVLQWTQDSTYRFFPLVEHEILGLTLHPFDLATNKVLALVGRLEARDWIDVLTCHDRIQPLGYLAWAACGKDPGFSPSTILEQAGRSTRYSAAEIGALSFSGPAPDAGELSRKWKAILDQAWRIVDLLPPDQTGRCVIDGQGALVQSEPEELEVAARAGAILFHAGSIRGAWPEVR